MKVIASQQGKRKNTNDEIRSQAIEVFISEIEPADIASLEEVNIICEDDVIIRQNREKLSGLSDYFRALLLGNFRETTQKNICLNYVDAELLRHLLEFYEKYQSRKQREYDDNFSRVFIKDFRTAWLLIEIADMLGLEEAAIECDKYVIQTLETNTCIEVCSLAEQFSRFSIELEAVRKWIVDERITNNPFTNGTHCNEMCSNKSCMCQYVEKYHQVHTFYVLGGYFYEHFRECDSIEANALISEGDTPYHGAHHSTELKSGFSAGQCFPGPHNEECRVAALDTDIYVTGGFDEKAKALAQVWKYNTRLDEWKRVSDLRHARFYHCIASVGEYLYVCGGYDDNFVLSSLERYHPHYNEWVDMSDMLTGVGNAAFSNDEYGIYVLCGQYGYKEVQTTNVVQYYSISADQWTLLTRYDSPVFYPHSEYGLSSLMLDGKIHVLGGQTERCDVYDVDKDEWKRISDMICRRMEAAVISYNGRIYAAGGYDYKTGQYHDTIEEYDPEKNKWRTLQQRMPRPARSIGFCHVFDVKK
uniref:kelch-like protein 23 n=1 Tax=Styela clava TaxID=7725 RepID=UPI00193A4E4A|nr:kelch-like protein 23 [Styela clava]